VLVADVLVVEALGFLGAIGEDAFAEPMAARDIM